MQVVFADTDILLDLLAQRTPFYGAAAALFTRADKGEIEIAVSSLSFSNLHYLLAKQYSREKARTILLQLNTLVTVLPVDEKVIDLALVSTFYDFEDAIQYYACIEHGITILLTRNLRDYSTADIHVSTAEAYIKAG